jgi:hypothetical protein
MEQLFTQKPTCDDSKVREICYRIIYSKAIIVCIDLGIFDYIMEAPHSLSDIAQKFNLAEKNAEALLIACIAEDLIYEEDKLFYLHKVAEEYLCENSLFSYTNFIKYLYIDLDEARSYSNIKNSIINNIPAKLGTELFKQDFYSSTQAIKFASAMYSKSLAPSKIWPDHVDLSNKKLFIDVGGGIGIHSIEACKKFPQLKAKILEKAQVVGFGENFVKKHRMENKVEFLYCDFFVDEIPIGDVYFLSDILHDWDDQKCSFILKQIFKKLENGGILLIHEIFFNDSKTGPWSAAAYNLSMRVFSEGYQYSRSEMFTKLGSIGFKNIEYKNTFGDWGIVTAQKLA